MTVPKMMAARIPTTTICPTRRSHHHVHNVPHRNIRDLAFATGVAAVISKDEAASHLPPKVQLLLRASNKTLIPDVETTAGQSLNGIRAVRFLDQGEPGVEIVELAMPYAGKFMRRSRSWKRASERRLSHLGSTPK